MPPDTADTQPGSPPSVARRGGRPPAGSAVIERAFALLSTFDAGHRAQPLAELARRSGIPRSSALRLARTLMDAGALERQDDGRFVIGLRLLEIASLAPRGHGLRAVAMPYMEDLFQVTRQHVLLAVRDNQEALLVERLSARDASPVRYRVGGRLPLTSTGVGLVLLAYAPADLQETVIDAYRPRAGEGDEDLITSGDLRRVLAEIRRGGYAQGSQRHPWAVTTVAAPIREGDEVVAALSIVAPSASVEIPAYAPAIQAAARAISRSLEH